MSEEREEKKVCPNFFLLFDFSSFLERSHDQQNQDEVEESL